MADAEELQLKAQESRLKKMEYLWKLLESSFDKNLRVANMALVGNAAAFVACVTIFKDFKDKMAIEVLASAGFFFCVGMIASSVTLALVWLASELSVVKHQDVALNDFSDESIKEFMKLQHPFFLVGGRSNTTAIAIAGIIMTVPYAVAVACFFLGITKVANNITCMLACT